MLEFNRALLEGVRGVLVGYSGGADSSLLLHLLAEESKKSGFALEAFHVNHGIRGDEADRDESFCVEVSDRLGVKLHVVRADVPALAGERGVGIEQAARELRYETIARICRESDVLDTAATAHNADDNAETILFNLARGTGLDGLAGIPRERMLEFPGGSRGCDGTDGISGIRIIRPLLACSKREIIAECERRSIAFVHDSTNDDTKYTRNFIRHELIPRLEKLNPSFLTAAARLSTSVRADASYLENEAKKLLESLRLEDKREFDAAALANAPRALASRAVRLAFAEHSSATLETVHIDSLLALSDGELSLPGRITARVKQGRLSFRSTGDNNAPPELGLELKPGINCCESPDFAILVAPEGSDPEQIQKDNEFLKNIYNLSIHKILNSDTINHMLYARSRRAGDAYVCGGIKHKLRRMFIDAKLPTERRAELPIICDGDGIVWVPGFSQADRVKETEGSGRLTLYYYFQRK